VVRFCVRQAAGKNTASVLTPANLIKLIQLGLSVQELKDLQISLAVPIEQLVTLLGMSKATFHRRKAGGRLAPANPTASYASPG
jgi:uncharacterized protein (DUF2384 family)